MYRESNTIQLDLKADGDAPEGAGTATFSTFNIVDHDGDVVAPGAFQDQKEVPIGAYQHAIDKLPVGKGIIRSDNERAHIDGSFFLDTPHGDATYRTIKNLDDIEWSYIFTVEDSEVTPDFTVGDDLHHDVRILKKLDVWSIDPVLRGAGIGTGTDSIKSIATQSFADHADELLSTVGAFTARAQSRYEMRAKEDRTLSADDRIRIAALVSELQALKVRLEDVLQEPVQNNVELQQLHAQFLELDSRLRR